MSQDTNVENLIINKLTKAQYENIANPDSTQLYFVTDEVISSSDVISALGYTPYNATNPEGYTSNIGTITSVNNIQPDANGNVTLTIPDTATWGNITGTLTDQTDLQNALDAKQNTISDLSTIRSGASAGATALQPNDNITELVNNAGYITGITSSDVTTALGYTPYNATNPNGYITASALTPYALSADLASVATSGDYDDLINKPTIPTVNNGTLTIQKNGTTIGTFTANQSGNSTVNIEADTVLTDDITVSKNSDEELQAIGVIDNNSGNAIKTWTGTKAQYEAIVTKDSTTLYFLTDVGKIYFGDTLISNVGNNTLLDFKWADHKLNDIQWLRADTFSWQDGNVYNAVYTHLVADIDGITAETETIGSYTVTFYRATDGHKVALADQEQTVLNIYNTYGIAWYYILDTTNTQFKLPRTKYGFEGLRTNVGDKIDESLPNITGGAILLNGGNSGDGALYVKEVSTVTNVANGSNTYCRLNTMGFDASRSSSTYQDNAPVQERATQMYLYFYVGDYTQTAIEQTAGLNAELFNGKADVDGSNTIGNLSTATKSYLYSLRQASTQVINNVITANNTPYTAPADGEIIVTGYKNTNGGDAPVLIVNNIQVLKAGNYNASNIVSYAVYNYKVQAGDIIKTLNFSVLESSLFRYAKGAI